MSADVTTAFTWGALGVAGEVAEPHRRMEEPLLPADVRELALTLPPGAPPTAYQRTHPLFDAVRQAAHQGARHVMLTSVPLAAWWGRPATTLALSKARTDQQVTVDATLEATVAALAGLGATRVALASPWDERVNAPLTTYLTHAGIEVAATAAAGLTPAQFAALSIDEGFLLAMRLGRQAAQQAGDAAALLLPGRAWRALAAAPLLEDDLGLPVLTDRTVDAWRLMTLGVAPPLAGWGRLLEHP